MEERIRMAEESIEELYKLSKDMTIETALRDIQIKERVDRILFAIPNVENQSDLAVKQKAKIYFLRGKSLEILPQYSKEAEEFLSKAVKFAPEMMDAWNSLGHCFWKKNDLLSAHNCYSTALQLSPNKVSYRELSRVLRLIDASKQVNKSSNVSEKEQRLENITQSVAMAKKALAIDLEDGESWCKSYNSVSNDSSRLPWPCISESLYGKIIGH